MLTRSQHQPRCHRSKPQGGCLGHHPRGDRQSQLQPGNPNPAEDRPHRRPTLARVRRARHASSLADRGSNSAHARAGVVSERRLRGAPRPIGPNGVCGLRASSNRAGTRAGIVGERHRSRAARPIRPAARDRVTERRDSHQAGVVRGRQYRRAVQSHRGKRFDHQVCRCVVQLRGGFVG